MRVTDNILFNNFLYNVNKVNERSYKNNEKMASGKRLTDLSSDPIALSKALSLKDINSRFEQYTTNINSANAVFDAEDTTLANVDNLIQQAGALLIKGANSTNNDEASSTAISQELDAIKEEIKNSANTVFQGKYIFSGYKTDTPPIQNKVAEVAITDKDKTTTETAVADNYKDINSFDSGDYTIKINNKTLSIVDSSGNIVPIDANGSDESNVGGNSLATQIDISDKANQWIDTGRGIKIKLSEADINSSADVKISYTAGGNNLYFGDDGERNVEYSDKLSSPVNVTAKSIYKPTNQTLENNNYLIDKNTQGAATKETKLTDMMLTESLQSVKLETGDKIEINGNDHNGNLVKGAISVTSGMTLASFTKAVTALDSTEVLENNRVFTLPEDKFATASTKLSSLGITSNIDFSGATHASTAVNATFTNSAAATLGDLASFISNNFGVTAQVKHGIIDLTDSTPGKSSLRVNAQTHDNNSPVLGVFYETSKGGSGGFKDVVDTYVKDGRLNFVDKRPSDSKFNLEFNITDASDNPKPNIFGVFNTKTYGHGVDVFKELENASSALKNPDAFNQIGTPTNWSEGTTLTPTVSGKYFGGNNDIWSVKVVEGSNDLSQAGAESKLTVQDSLRNTVANIEIKNNGGKYDIKVTDNDGKIIYNAPQQHDLSKIVIESKGAENNFNAEGVNGTAGVTLNLSQTASLTPSFAQGDSFSFKLSNAIEDSIGKSEKMLSQILSSRAIVGARTKRFQLAKSRITTTKISNLKTISDLEDANMAEVFSEYQRNQVVMQATLNIGAKLTAHSLFDYL